MKKILLISHDASLTGAPKSIMLIGKLLKENGYEIRWIIGKPGPRSADFEVDHSKYWSRDLSNASLTDKIIFKLKGGINGHKRQVLRWVRNWSPDLIINNTVVNGEIVEYLSTLNKPIISRIPEMQSVMAYYDTFNRSTSKVFQYSKKIVAASDAVKEQILEHWNQPEEKVDVIYTGTDMLPLPKSKHDRFTVSACGTMISRKGIDLFLLVAKECIRQGANDIVFQWIGGNPSSLGYFEVLEDVRKLELENNIVIHTETKDIRPHLAVSDLFLMTSKEDPFPIVNLEALLHQLPIICFEKSGGTEDIINKGGGMSVPYMDIAEMSKQIIRFKRGVDMDLTKTIDSFSINQMKKDWLTLLGNEL